MDGAATSTTGDDPLNRLAAAMRRISGVAVALPLSDEELAAAAAELAALADRLEAAAPAEKRTRLQPTADGHPQDHFPTSPMIGFANPIAPPVDVWAVTGEGGQREIRGKVTFGYQYEGPPTCVHGGVIAELFDELLGLANIIVGQAGMTGTLKVRYRRPTPLLAPLELVSRFTGREGARSSPGAASTTRASSRPRPTGSSSRCCRARCSASCRATPTWPRRRWSTGRGGG